MRAEPAILSRMPRRRITKAESALLEGFAAFCLVWLLVLLFSALLGDGRPDNWLFHVPAVLAGVLAAGLRWRKLRAPDAAQAVTPTSRDSAASPNSGSRADLPGVHDDIYASSRINA